MKYKLLVCLFSIYVIINSGLVSNAFAQSALLTPVDKTPDKNPCGPRPDDDAYKQFKEQLKNILSDKGGVLADINKQIADNIPKDKQKSFTVEINTATLDEFKKEWVADHATNPTPEEKAKLEQEAENNWQGNGAYTYTTNKKAGGVTLMKIKVFCKGQQLQSNILDGTPIYRYLIHELVHAKLFTIMLTLGLSEAQLQEKLGFNNHGLDESKFDVPEKDGGDKGFFDEVERLLKKFKKNFGLSFAPNGQSSSSLFANAVFIDPETGELIHVALDGDIAINMGPLGDSNRNGLADVPIELVSLDLFSEHGDEPQITLDPHARSTGLVEEQSPDTPFPATGFFDISYIVDFEETSLNKQSHLSNDVNSWPPFGEAFVNPLPTPPFDLDTLAFAPSSPFEGLISDYSFTPGSIVVGGETHSIDTLTLFVAGTMANPFWIIPAVSGAAAAIVLSVIRAKKR